MLASEQDVYELADIEKYIGKKIPSQVADESLFAEDKSEGLRIRTDFYDDRGGGRREAPRGRREGGQSREAPRRGGAQRGDAKSADGRRSGENRRGGAESRRLERPAGRGTAEQAAGRPNLAQLSFEERMAYYKEKYGENAEGAQRESGRGQAGRARTAAQSETSAQGGTRRGAEARKDGKDRRSRNRPRKGGEKSVAQSGAENTLPARETPAKQAVPEPKKGMLSKIFGIFKKRGD
jgi:ATP-dependent RNA helicase RhlB